MKKGENKENPKRKIEKGKTIKENRKEKNQK